MCAILLLVCARREINKPFSDRSPQSNRMRSLARRVTMREKMSDEGSVRGLRLHCV